MITTSFIILLAFLLGLAGQTIAQNDEIGVTICACQPAIYTIGFNFSLVCADGNVAGDGILDITCLIGPEGSAEVEDLKPVVLTQVRIVEVDGNNKPLAVSTNTGEIFDGGNITYTSVVLTNPDIVSAGSFPAGIQMTATAVNEKLDELSMTWVITYDNDCSVFPLLDTGERLGWSVFVAVGDTPPEFCPIATPPVPPTAAPIVTEMPSVAPVTDAPVTDAPVTDAPVTDAPVTDAPVTDAPVTEAPVTEAPVTDTPVTDAPVTDAPVTDTPVTEAPGTDAPVIVTPVTDAPVTDAPVTITPTAFVTRQPVMLTPVTDAPVTDAPVTDAPVTDAPVTDAPVATDRPTAFVTRPPIVFTPVTEQPVTGLPTTMAPTLPGKTASPTCPTGIVGEIIEGDEDEFIEDDEDEVRVALPSTNTNGEDESTTRANIMNHTSKTKKSKKKKKEKKDYYVDGRTRLSTKGGRMSMGSKSSSRRRHRKLPTGGDKECPEQVVLESIERATSEPTPTSEPTSSPVKAKGKMGKSAGSRK